MWGYINFAIFSQIGHVAAAAKGATDVSSHKNYLSWKNIPLKNYPTWNSSFRQRQPPSVYHASSPLKLPSWKFTIATICVACAAALLTRDLSAITTFLIHCYFSMTKSWLHSSARYKYITVINLQHFTNPRVCLRSESRQYIGCYLGGRVPASCLPAVYSAV